MVKSGGEGANSHLGHDPNLLTNRRLVGWLRAYFGLELEETYGTNLFPFIKPGGMSAPIAPSLLKKAAARFALPQIKIVNPRVVICFGLATYNAIAAAVVDHSTSGQADKPTAGDLGVALTRQFSIEGTRATCWCLPHPAARMSIDRVEAHWRAVAKSIGANRDRPVAGERSSLEWSILLAERALKSAKRDKSLREELVRVCTALLACGANHRAAAAWVESDLKPLSEAYPENQGVKELVLLSSVLQDDALG